LFRVGSAAPPCRFLVPLHRVELLARCDCLTNTRPASCLAFVARTIITSCYRCQDTTRTQNSMFGIRNLRTPRELSQPNQFGELPRIDAVILITFLQQSILPWIAYHQFRDAGLQQVIPPGRPGSFFKGEVHVSAQPIDKFQELSWVHHLSLRQTYYSRSGRTRKRCLRVLRTDG